MIVRFGCSIGRHFQHSRSLLASSRRALTPCRKHASIRTWLVDAFTDKPFRGNPAEIMYLPHDYQAMFEDSVDLTTWMQQIAAENHIPVTSFLLQLKPREYAIRWFTPTKELELCGHGTITAAHVLYNELKEISSHEKIHFHTKFNGVVSTQQETVNSAKQTFASSHFIRLDFPNTRLKPHKLSASDKVHLAQAFSLSNVSFLDKQLFFTGKTLYDIVLHVSPSLFHQLPYETIDFERLKQVETPRGIIITTSEKAFDHDTDGNKSSNNDSSALSQYDFLHRMFLPRYGINEDHVSGSGFCAIAEYWQRHLTDTSGHSSGNNNNHTHDNTTLLVGLQKSKRSGTVLLKISDVDPDQVLLYGQCSTVKAGRLLVSLPSLV